MSCAFLVCVFCKANIIPLHKISLVCGRLWRFFHMVIRVQLTAICSLLYLNERITLICQTKQEGLGQLYCECVKDRQKKKSLKVTHCTFRLDHTLTPFPAGCPVIVHSGCSMRIFTLSAVLRHLFVMSVNCVTRSTNTHHSTRAMTHASALHAPVPMATSLYQSLSLN